MPLHGDVPAVNEIEVAYIFQYILGMKWCYNYETQYRWRIIVESDSNIHTKQWNDQKQLQFDWSHI